MPAVAGWTVTVRGGFLIRQRLDCALVVGIGRSAASREIASAVQEACAIATHVERDLLLLYLCDPAIKATTAIRPLPILKVQVG